MVRQIQPLREAEASSNPLLRPLIADEAMFLRDADFFWDRSEILSSFFASGLNTAA